jgi:CheY-like chemotaxis protein
MQPHTHSVLIIEDDPDIRDALADILRDRGFSVVGAGNGREALTLLRGLAAPPSAILLDLMMPVLDGYGFLEEQRQDASLAGIPVAIVTAGRKVERSRIDEAIPIVPKPINVPLLFTVLDEMCTTREAHP